jgi:hypothetical protein
MSSERYLNETCLIDAVEMGALDYISPEQARSTIRAIILYYAQGIAPARKTS